MKTNVAGVPLAELSAQAARLSHELSKLAALLPQAAMVTPGEIEASWIRRTIRLRRLRERFFPPELFADPAWDMLLDLTEARLEGVPVSVSSLCLAACVPATTALRWIGTMTEMGLLLREPDPADRRRAFVRLTEDAVACMERCLTAVQAEGGMV
jgi:hypothetical protein